jgi:hypothetical protein
MLTDKIQEVDGNSSASDPTDIFEQSLFTIFSDSRNQHGEPGQYVVYKSSVYGDVKLRLADPDPDNHSLFSHFVWNAGCAFFLHSPPIPLLRFGDSFFFFFADRGEGADSA